MQYLSKTSIFALLTIAMLATAPLASANDVNWSVTVGSVGSGYAPPAAVYVQPEPVYVQPRPVYVRPAPVIVQPATVVQYPAPYYVEDYRSRGHGHWKHHHPHHPHH